MLALDAFVGEPLEEVRDRHHRDGSLEQRRIPEDRQQRDHPAVAPADNRDAGRVDLRVLRLQHIRRSHHVVDFRAAVVDGVVEGLAVADAAAILGRDDDVTLRRRFADVRNVVLVEMSTDVLVNPQERRVPLRAAQLQRLEDERRDVDVTHLAAVGDLLHLHEAVAGGAPCLVGVGLLLQLTIEVGRALLERPAGARRLR